MPALTGTATPWREWPIEGVDGEWRYVRDGHRRGDLDLLVEALRADGVADSLQEAYSLVDAIGCTQSHYGYLPGEPEPVECDARGETNDGDQVEVTFPCLFAVLESPDGVGPSRSVRAAE